MHWGGGEGCREMTKLIFIQSIQNFRNIKKSVIPSSLLSTSGTDSGLSRSSQFHYPLELSKEACKNPDVQASSQAS